MNARQEIDPELDVAAMLRRCGLRATPSRLKVLETLQEISSPITHAELTHRLRSCGFDKATLFRSLAVLVEAGLVWRTELGDHVWRFEIVRHRRQQVAHHPHFVCNDCGSIYCLDDLELTIDSLNRLGQVGTAVEVLLRGNCQDCARTEGPA